MDHIGDLRPMGKWIQLYNGTEWVNLAPTEKEATSEDCTLFVKAMILNIGEDNDNEQYT